MSSCCIVSKLFSAVAIFQPPIPTTSALAPQQKFRVNKQELEVMFDVEPSSAGTPGTEDPPQCQPPAAETIAALNAAKIRVSAEEAVEGGNEANGGSDGSQKVTPWEVEVSIDC